MEYELPNNDTEQRGTRDFWQRWISSAKRAAERHWNDAKAAWAEYEAEAKEPGTINVKQETVERCYPIYWSRCKTLEPAYYSRTPQVATRRRFDIDDPVALTGSVILERLGTYLCDTTDFDNVMRAAVSDFIHADKATCQVIYEYDSEQTVQQLPVVPVEGGGYTLESGESFEGEVTQLDTGLFGEQTTEIRKNKRILLTPLCFDEVLHTPDAKIESEVTEKAYHFCLTKEEALKKFGDKLTDFSNWKTKKSGEKDYESSRDRESSPEKYLEGWEIWCKVTKKAYFYSEQYAEGLLDIQDNPYGLREFFPSPAFAIGSKPRKSLYPTPAYIHLEPTINQLHEQAAKVRKLVDSIRRRALVNGDDTMVALLNSGDQEFIIARNLTALIEKGGVDGLIWYLPVQELVSAISELNALEERFKANFDEWFGTPAILQGVSDPIESATAQEIKTSAAHDRFKDQKKRIGQLAADSLELMIDLALSAYDDVELYDICGIQYAEPEVQQNFGPALQMLRNDTARIIRIDIDTDSMSFIDERLKAAQVAQAVTTVTNGLRELAAMAQTQPQFVPVGLKALLLTLETIPAGRQFQEGIKGAIQELMDKINNPPEPPPPPPDYEQMKLDLQAQKQQMDAQVKVRELDQKDFSLQVKAQKTAHDAQIADMKQMLDQTVQQFMMTIEGQRLQIDQFKAQMAAAESQMEEIRLAREVEMKSYAEAVKAAQATGPAEVQPPQVIQVQTPPMTVVVEGQKQGDSSPKTTKIDVVRDEFGNPQSYIKTELPLASLLPGSNL